MTHWNQQMLARSIRFHWPTLSRTNIGFNPMLSYRSTVMYGLSLRLETGACQDPTNLLCSWGGGPASQRWTRQQDDAWQMAASPAISQQPDVFEPPKLLILNSRRETLHSAIQLGQNWQQSQLAFLAVLIAVNTGLFSIARSLVLSKHTHKLVFLYTQRQVLHFVKQVS